jgi:transposase
MNYKIFVGIDVSKEKLDMCIIENAQQESYHHLEIANNKQAFKKVKTELTKKFGKWDETWLFCLEHTGVYALPMCKFLSDAGMNYALVPALQIQKSIGMRRGKSDKADSKDIARYAMLFAAEIKTHSLPEAVIHKMQVLLGQRERLIKCKVTMKTASKENSAFLDKQLVKASTTQGERVIKYLNTEIEKVNAQLTALVEGDEKSKQVYQLISSVPGVGPQTAYHLMVATRCFTTFENARQLASYCGVAPFEYSSGKSIRGKTKVSHLANKKIKSLLNMCALNAKDHDPQIKNYYQRKITEGKNPMSVLNAVRNKLLQRIFATVQRGTPYVKLQPC